MQPMVAHAIGRAQLNTLEAASQLAIGYFRWLATSAGLPWDAGNDDEIRLLIACIAEAAR